MLTSACGQPATLFAGIGENGHWHSMILRGHLTILDAINIITLDAASTAAVAKVVKRFEKFHSGLTAKIPTLSGAPNMFVSVPTSARPQCPAHVRRPISTACPRPSLRTHPDVTLYLDRESASKFTDQSSMTSKRKRRQTAAQSYKFEHMLTP